MEMHNVEKRMEDGMIFWECDCGEIFGSKDEATCLRFHTRKEEEMRDFERKFK